MFLLLRDQKNIWHANNYIYEENVFGSIVYFKFIICVLDFFHRGGGTFYYFFFKSVQQKEQLYKVRFMRDRESNEKSNITHAFKPHFNQKKLSNIVNIFFL